MDFPPSIGGMSAVASSLALWSSKQPEVEKVAVVSFYNSKPRHEVEGKLEIFAYASQTMLAMFLLALKRLWGFKNFDIIHATNIFPIGAISVLLGKYIFGKKVFISVYGTDVLAVTPWPMTKAIKKWTLKHCQRVFVCSQSTRLQVASAYQLPLTKMAVVYVGVGEDILTTAPKNIRAEYGLAENDFVVVTVGRLVKRKGVDDLIRAIKEIPDQSVKLLIVGEGEAKENLIKLASELGLEKRVIFAGRVASVADYYYSADVFSMPSKYLTAEGDIEGLGIVYLEAQYFGLPVIGTFSGGIPEAMEVDKTGYLVSEGDSQALAEKIIYLKNNPETYQKFSQSAKELLKTKFSWSDIIKQVINIYQE